MMKGWAKNHSGLRGFTIVELLIVVVIIAILAAITIVAYNGIQQRAQDSMRIAAMRSIQTALTMYYSENGAYPNVCFEGGVVQNEEAAGQHCKVERLYGALVPQYMSMVPDMSSLPYHKQVFYAAGNAAGSTYYMYAVAFGDGSGPYLSAKCRIISPGVASGDPGYSHFSPPDNPIDLCY